VCSSFAAVFVRDFWLACSLARLFATFVNAFCSCNILNTSQMSTPLGFSPRQCRQIFDAIDYDHDGEIGFDEFCFWITRVVAQVFMLPACQW
jgi:hypothetical protein